MQLTGVQTILIILAVALGTMVTRFTPFFLFPENRRPPKIITDLGKVLPSAMMGLLVVYCLKDVKMAAAPYGIPEALAIGLIILLHKWKQNVLLSIAGGTLVYMILIQSIGV